MALGNSLTRIRDRTRGSCAPVRLRSQLAALLCSCAPALAGALVQLARNKIRGVRIYDWPPSYSNSYSYAYSCAYSYAYSCAYSYLFAYPYSYSSCAPVRQHSPAISK